MRKNIPYMVLDITKKPGDPNAVKTGDTLLAENTKLREALVELTKAVQDWFNGGELLMPMSIALEQAKAALAATSSEVSSVPSVSEVPSVPSDTAKLREVAEFVAHIDDNGYTSHDVQCAIDKARAALAAPARNCDRFADETDAQIAFLNEVWLISVTKETALERDKFENWTDEMRSRYAKWLLAPAPEKEGGAKC